MLAFSESSVMAFNAALIVVSGLFLLLGYGFIRAKRVLWHQRSMIAACVFAVLFLVVYVARYALLGTKAFAGEGLLRAVYFGILVPHTIIAALVAPLAFITLRRALRGQFAQHRRMARVTFPLWLWTAASGWVVYWMLYWL